MLDYCKRYIINRNPEISPDTAAIHGAGWRLYAVSFSGTRPGASAIRFYPRSSGYGEPAGGAMYLVRRYMERKRWGEWQRMNSASESIFTVFTWIGGEKKYFYKDR